MEKYHLFNTAKISNRSGPFERRLVVKFIDKETNDAAPSEIETILACAGNNLTMP